MKTLFCLFPFIFFLTVNCFSQDSANYVFQINKLPPEGILLDKGWKFQGGDNLAYALSGYDDSRWQAIDPTKDIHDIPELLKNNIIWFRLRFAFDSVLFGRLAVTIQQSGAAEIYLNGKLTHRLGIVSKHPYDVRAFNPLAEPLSFPVEKAAEQVIAVRFALQPNITYSYFLRAQNPGLKMTVNTVENAARQQWLNRGLDSGRHVFRVGAFFMLAILYLAFYLFSRTQKINLLFSLYAFLQGINFLLVVSHLHLNKVAYWFPLHLLINIIQVVDYVILLYAIYRLLEQKVDWLYYCLAAFAVVCIPINFFTYSWGWLIYGFAFTTLYNCGITWISFKAVRKQKKGAWIITAGGMAYLIFWLLMALGFFGIIHPTYNYLFFSHFFLLYQLDLGRF